MKEYFYNKNYVAIYLHNICENFASSLVSVLGVVLLYNLGFPIWAILLFYAFQFWLMWLLSPLCPIIVSKIWIPGTVFLSSVFKAIGTSFLLFAWSFSQESIFFIFILFSIAEGIYNPLPNSITSYYIQDRHKGRVNSINAIIRALITMLSITIWAYFIVNALVMELLSLIILFYIIGVWVYQILLDRIELPWAPSFISVFRYLFHARFRENLIPFWLETFLIIELIFLPLFIYVFVGDLQIVSYIVSFALWVEVIILIAFGKKIDAFSQSSFFQSMVLKSISSLSFILFTINIWWTFICNTYMRISYAMFLSSFGTLLQKKAKKESNPIVFSATKEMILCFTEFFILLLFAGLAYFMGNNIFIIIFISASAAVAWIYYKWRD